MKAQKFKIKLLGLLAERNESLDDMKNHIGVHRETVHRGIKTRPTLCAIAYHLEMKVEDLIDGTEMEEIWYG